jgi:DNA polymerase-3 subunit delta'
VALRSKLEGLHPTLNRLIDDYRHDRSPQALLLSGAQGIGKEELAGYLASILLCIDTDDKPCGHCTACQRLVRGVHANMLRLALTPREKSIKIDQLRKLLEVLALNPLQAGRRVVMILDIDTMTVQAQNALLKSLEEPDEGTYFMLSTKNEQAVLPTIMSRCRLMRLLPWPDEKMLDYLRSEGIAEERARELTSLSRGLPGMALQLDRDTQYWAIRQLLDESLFNVKTLTDIPDASAALKETRDMADLVLDLVEQRAQLSLMIACSDEMPNSPHPWHEASPTALMRVLQAVMTARKYRNSNVSWQAILDRLLFTITKEIYACQWS